MATWADLTLAEVGEAAAGGAVAVLPVGAVEQHGPHLATGTDTFLAVRASVAAAERTGDICLPALAYGCSHGHTDHWPGTISLSPTTMIEVLLDIGRWVYASGFRKLVIVNGHVTNPPPCQSAVLQLRHELPDMRLRFVSTFDVTPAADEAYTADAADWHANDAETSMLLHLEPGLVRPELAVDEPDRTVGLVMQYPMPSVTRSGVVGQPTAADPAKGERIFGVVVDGLTDLLTKARTEVDPL